MAIEKWDKLNIPDKLDAIAGWCIMGATDEEIYTNLGVGKTTFNRWKTKHPELMELLKRKKPIANAAVIGSIYRAARGFEYEEVRTEYEFDKNGKQGKAIKIIKTKKYFPPNPTLAIYYTKNRDSKNWSDRQYLDIKDQQVPPELKQTINILAILNQKHPEAFDAFVEVTTVPGANGAVRKRKQLLAKTKTKRRKKTNE